MGNTIDIIPDHLTIIQKILKEQLPNNAKVWVFGSRARGKARRASDLDLAIDADRKLTKQEASELFHAFEGSDLPYKVDVVDLNSISEDFKKIIDNEKKLLGIYPEF